jgi:spore germination protein KB
VYLVSLPKAGKDAWIVTLLSVVFGALLILLYFTLMRMRTGLTLVQCFPAQFGRWIGTPLAWLYPLLFLYLAGRDLRNFGEVIR